MAGFAGGLWYISYYQSMNLTTDDANSIVKGYYLLEDFKEQLIKAKDKKEETKTQKTSVI